MDCFCCFYAILISESMSFILDMRKIEDEPKSGRILTYCALSYRQHQLWNPNHDKFMPC